VFQEFTYTQTPYAYLVLVGLATLVIGGGEVIKFAVGDNVVDDTVKYLNNVYIKITITIPKITATQFI
jgi:hypothetical protein